MFSYGITVDILHKIYGVTLLVVSIDFYGNAVYNKTIEKNGTAQRAEKKITMKKFEIGKTYTMESLCDRNCVWTYTVTKRTAKTITISDGTETKTCRVNAQVSEDRNAETIFPVGRYSMCPTLSADKEEMTEVQEPAEEAEVETKIITFPRRNVMKGFDGLLRSEIKKVESFAKKRDGRDSRITGYGYHEAKDADGFLVVKCEICSNDMRDREDDVSIFVYIPDRRRSFICSALDM